MRLLKIRFLALLFLILYSFIGFSQLSIKNVNVVFSDSIIEYERIYAMLEEKEDSIKDRLYLGTKKERFTKLARLAAIKNDTYVAYINKEFKKLGINSLWVHESDFNQSLNNYYLTIRNGARIKSKTGRIFLTYICSLYDFDNKLILKKEDKEFFKALKTMLSNKNLSN